MALMEFKPFERRVAKAPVGAFSSLMEQRLQQFKQGEEITDNAKEVFGLWEVGKDDQKRRNEIAEAFNTDIDALLEQYDGAYESLKFQRDAKKLIRDYAKHEAFPAMQATKEEVDFEENLRREAAKNPAIQLYDFNRGKDRSTKFDPATGYTSYRTGLETAQNHLKDARDHLGQLIPNMSEIKPGVERLKIGAMKDLDLLRTGAWKGIGDTRIKNRSVQMVDQFGESMQGGNQMARKFAFEQGYPSIYDENGVMREDVRAFLADYLYRVGSEQVHSQINTHYTIPPEYVRGAGSSIWGSAVTNAALSNNPEADKFGKISPDDLKGRGLQGEAAARLAELTAKKFPTTRAGRNLIQLTQEEEAERKRLREYNERLLESDGLTSYLRAFRKTDGTLDYTAMDETHRGLYDAYMSVIEESDMTEEDALGGGISDPRLLNFLDDRVLKRYNAFVDRHLVAVGKGYDLSEDDVEYFKRNWVGDVGTAGLGRITEMGLISPEGEQTNIRKVAEDEGFDLSDPDAAIKFKKSIQLKQNLIPLINNGVAQVDIAGKTYTVTSDEFAKKAKADNLSAVGPVLLGNKTESEQVQLSFLGGVTGKFEADHEWDEDDNYTGNGIVFTFDDKGVEKFFTLDEVISIYLSNSDFYNVEK